MCCSVQQMVGMDTNNGEPHVMSYSMLNDSLLIIIEICKMVLQN